MSGNRRSSTMTSNRRSVVVTIAQCGGRIDGLIDVIPRSVSVSVTDQRINASSSTTSTWSGDFFTAG